MTDDIETKQRFAAAMMAMYKAFNKTPDKDISKILFFALQHVSIETAEECITQAILTEERFPTPAALKKCLALIPARAMAKIEYQPFGHRDEQLAERSGKLINGYLDGKLTREVLIEGMQVMDKSYPGMGWSSEAAKLVSFFRETPPSNTSPISVNMRL